MMARNLTTLSAVALGASLLLGCKVNPTDPKVAASPAGAECKAPEALICDGDDNNNQTAVIANRGGYWYTYSDMVGTEVWPLQGAKGGTFEMSPGGAENSPYAARFKGTVAAQPSADQYTQAGMGLNFVDPKGPYDASQYGGISFWAKAAPGSVTDVRIKIPDNNTDPDGGVCTECFNDFGMELKLTNEWQHYVIRFKDLKQEAGWGAPKKFGVDRSAVYGIQFQTKVPEQPFDIWVDQIRFTGCSDG